MWNESARTSRAETLLIELSARFINLPSNQVDREIEDAQRTICESLDMDRSMIWQESPNEPDAFLLTHIYQRPDAPSVITLNEGKTFFPWALEQLRQGRTIAIARMDELPPEAARDKESWRHYGTKSTVVVPLTIGEAGLGAVSFASVRERLDWPETLVRRLELVAQVFAGAIARAGGEKALRDSEARKRAIIETATDGIITIDERGLIETINPAAIKIFGYAPDEVIGRNINMLMPEPYRAEHDSYIDNYLRTGARKIIGSGREVTGRRKDGSVFAMDLAVSEIRLAEGRRMFTGIVRDISERKRAEEQLRRTLDEVQRLRDRLERENTYLRHETNTLKGRTRLVGQSLALQQVLAQVEQVAATDSTVLLLGETGTGKELIASAIHDLSGRNKRPMVRVNCAAIPSSLLESELFGREKGAYTGALSKQIGRFEMAEGSTLFLDEIGDLPADVQVKLLRVLEERQIERLGNPKPIHIDVRIITATNKDLEKAVREGRFREDLFYRLNVFPITLPPLRDRREDVPGLVSAFVQEFVTQFGKKIESISAESMKALQSYGWPGNVRELRNVIERAMIVARGPRLWIEPPQKAAAMAAAPHLAMRAAEGEHIRRVLDMTGWRIRGKQGAAQILGMKPTTLESRMARLGILRGSRNPTK